MVMKAAAQSETRTIPAGEFKAKCLKLMDDAVVTQQSFTITKRGKAVGQFVPVQSEEKHSRPFVGSSPGIKILGDIISPLPQEWTLPEWMWDKPKKSGKKAKRKK
jgi:antitoxin (DNA-binding transcriptional repressor) of toxin-antitoxin stability system